VKAFEDSRRGVATVIVLAVGVAALALLAGSGNEALRRTTVEALVLVTAVVGFYVFVGNSGVLSFGHVCFMAIGAYATAIFSMDPFVKESVLTDLPPFLLDAHLPSYVSCLAGGLVAGVVALGVSGPLMRLSGIAAALTSLALLQIVFVVSNEWRAVTNGTFGIDGIPMKAGVGTGIATAVGAIVVAHAFQRSRWGARLRASREDDVAARSLGVGVHLERRLAFVLSAAIVGVAGGLYVQLLGSITPTTLYLDTTFLLVVMLTVGGQTSLSGAVVGSVCIAVVRELLRRLEGGAHVGPVFIDGPAGLSEIGLALVLLLILIQRPAGLTGGREITFAWPPRRRPGKSATKEESCPTIRAVGLRDESH
jgi:branched-chain amino acid transport system permease protein